MTYKKITNRPQYKHKNKKLNDWERTQIIMDQIKSGKIKQLTSEERDELDKEYQVGKYRPWVYNKQRMNELEKQVSTEHSIKMSEAHSKPEANYNRGHAKKYNGKKQQAKELERLKSEIENG